MDIGAANGCEVHVMMSGWEFVGLYVAGLGMVSAAMYLIITLCNFIDERTR